MSLPGAHLADVSLDSYVLETLMPDIVGHDRHPSAFLIYLVLWNRTRGGQEKGVELSHRTLAESTGLSKRAVQLGLDILERRKLVSATRESITAVHRYTLLRPWARR